MEGGDSFYQRRLGQRLLLEVILRNLRRKDAPEVVAHYHNLLVGDSSSLSTNSISTMRHEEALPGIVLTTGGVTQLQEVVAFKQLYRRGGETKVWAPASLP